MSDFSFLVLGTGFWGTEWLRAISSLDGIEVAGTAGHDPTLPDGVTLAAGYQHFSDYRDAIVESRADAVLVVLPLALHADAVTRALEAGRHVVCEKPLARTTDEVRGLLAAAERHPDLVVMVNQNYRWRPWARYVRSLIRDGAVGDVSHIDVRFSQPEFLAGGRGDLQFPLLQDMSIHHFDLLRYLTESNAREVYARAFRPNWSEFSGSPGLDAIITMEGGVQVSYSGSWAGRGRATTWDGDWSIQGSRGLLAVVDGHPAIYPQLPNSSFAAQGNSLHSAEMLSVPESSSSDIRASLENFLQAVRSGNSPETVMADNRHSIAIVFAAEESIQTGRPVQVEVWQHE